MELLLNSIEARLQVRCDPGQKENKKKTKKATTPNKQKKKNFVFAVILREFEARFIFIQQSEKILFQYWCVYFYIFHFHSHFGWYEFNHPLCYDQDEAQGKILSGVQLVWMQNFPSRLVALPRRKSSVCPTIYLSLEEIWLFGFYCISIIVGHSMLNPTYTYILDKYEL